LEDFNDIITAEVPEDLLDLFNENGDGVIFFSEEDLQGLFNQQNDEGTISVEEIQKFFAMRMITPQPDDF